jgi:hypothetical protein
VRRALRLLSAQGRGQNGCYAKLFRSTRLLETVSTSHCSAFVMDITQEDAMEISSPVQQRKSTFKEMLDVPSAK